LTQKSEKTASYAPDCSITIWPRRNHTQLSALPNISTNRIGQRRPTLFIDDGLEPKRCFAGPFVRPRDPRTQGPSGTLITFIKPRSIRQISRLQLLTKRFSDAPFVPFIGPDQSARNMHHSQTATIRNIPVWNFSPATRDALRSAPPNQPADVLSLPRPTFNDRPCLPSLHSLPLCSEIRPLTHATFSFPSAAKSCSVAGVRYPRSHTFPTRALLHPRRQPYVPAGYDTPKNQADNSGPEHHGLQTQPQLKMSSRFLISCTAGYYADPRHEKQIHFQRLV
jgi:hypothetical protein